MRAQLLNKHKYSQMSIKDACAKVLFKRARHFTFDDVNKHSHFP